GSPAGSPRCSLQDLEQPPALGTREWPRLDDSHDVALLCLVGLVMGTQLAGPTNHLLIGPVAPDHSNLDRDRLVASRRDHGALTHLLGARFPLRRRGALRGLAT